MRVHKKDLGYIEEIIKLLCISAVTVRRERCEEWNVISEMAPDSTTTQIT